MIVILALQLLQVPRYALSMVRRLSCALLRIIICRDAFDLFFVEARAYKSATRTDYSSVVITRAVRLARETPKEHRTEMTLCTVAGPLEMLGTCISNSQDQYTIAHVPAWSVLPLRAVDASSSRKLAQFHCARSQWKKTHTSAGDHGGLADGPTPFPNKSRSFFVLFI